jgi:WD40 repeat protein
MVAFSGDGGLLGSASWDNTVRIWDFTTGEQIALLAHPGKVRALAFSPDRRYLATGMSFEPGKNVVLWGAEPGVFKKVATLDGNADGTVCMAFSSDGAILATGGQDHLIRLWDVDHRTELARLSGHSQVIENLVFSPDGKWLVSVAGKDRAPDQSGEIRVWDIAGSNAHPVQAFSTETGSITGLAFAPDGQAFATCGGDETVKVWAFETNHLGQGSTSPSPQVLWPRMAFQPEGGQPVRSLAVSHDGLIAAGSYRAVHLYRYGFGGSNLWVVDDARRAFTEPGTRLDRWMMNVDISTDGNAKLVAASSANGAIRVWEFPTGKEIAYLQRPLATTFPIAFLHGWRELLVTGRDQFIHSWNVDTRAMKQVAALHRPGGMDISPHRERLAFFSEEDPTGEVRVVSLEDGIVPLDGTGQCGSLVRRGVPGEVIGIRFLWDDNILLVAYRDRSVPRADRRNTLRSPDTTVESYSVHAWDVSKKTERMIGAWTTGGPILDMAVSGDGKHLALVGGRAGSTDPGERRAILLSDWDPNQRHQTTCQVLGGHSGAVRAVKFIDGDRHIVTACDDGLLRFWAPISLSKPRTQ